VSSTNDKHRPDCQRVNASRAPDAATLPETRTDACKIRISGLDGTHHTNPAEILAQTGSQRPLSTLLWTPPCRTPRPPQRRAGLASVHHMLRAAPPASRKEHD
jgi:hypothetical protein